MNRTYPGEPRSRVHEPVRYDATVGAPLDAVVADLTRAMIREHRQIEGLPIPTGLRTMVGELGVEVEVLEQLLCCGRRVEFTVEPFDLRLTHPKRSPHAVEARGRQAVARREERLPPTGLGLGPDDLQDPGLVGVLLVAPDPKPDVEPVPG